MAFPLSKIRGEMELESTVGLVLVLCSLNSCVGNSKVNDLLKDTQWMFDKVGHGIQGSTGNTDGLRLSEYWERFQSRNYFLVIFQDWALN